ncbi:Phosphomethylpyrimidine kinase-domain-containing protein [Flammula alnicola]|nr:Phosphomethylpyrimidine kinase-domain-containing protein [Flammula alnicola]
MVDKVQVVLTIAGSDSSGGAGIQADLKTFAAHGCYGASVITALTAQNTTGVQGVHACPPEFVEKQIHSVLDDLDVRAIKTGMLYDADAAKVIVDVLKSRFLPLQCPVCLLHPDALAVLISELFPISTLITPNKSEAELLLSQMGKEFSIKGLEDMLTAAETLMSVGCEAVLLKGGHVTTRMPDLVVDILYQRTRQKTMFVRPRIDSSSTHGTGCTLSSAIASELAKGASLELAVESATMYTHLGIQAASPIGKGHGPLNHFHNLTPSLIPQSAEKSWKEYVEHDFVRQLGKGTLDRECFVHFIKQDYHYLKYYARAYSLLAAKSTSFGLIESSTQTILNVLYEIGNHKAFCAKFGITEEDLESTPESAATSAYGAYIMDIGLQGDTTKLIMALMACLLGYGEVGLWLTKQSTEPNTWVVLEGNPYKHWIEEYSGEMYQGAVRIGLETVEACAAADPPSEARLKEWKTVWTRCTKLEKGFWDMAMELRE